MTLREWEKRLKKGLRTLSKEERQTALDYYREMYGDKLDAGESEEKILEEFGSPEACAEKILADEGKEAPRKKVKTTKGKSSPASIVGLVFFTLMLIVPLYACILGVIVSVAAGAVAGGACVLAGGVYVLFSPIYFGVNGLAFGGVIAHIGLGLVAAGVGIPLSIGFGYLTKLVSVGAVKLFKGIYFGRKEQ